MARSSRIHVGPIALAIVLSVVAGCPGMSMDSDGGSQRDAADAFSQDTTAEPDDAFTTGWQPMFAPRRIYRDDSVVCAPVPSLEFTAAAITAHPGDVVWDQLPSGQMGDDVDFLLDPFETFYWTQLPFTGATDGGFTAYGGGQIEVAFRPDGTYDYARRNLLGEAPAVRSLARLDAAGGVLVASAANGRVATLGTGHDTYSMPAIPYPEPRVREPMWLERVNGSMPVVMQDRGRVVWHAGYNLIVSTCIVGGATEWAVEYDSPARVPNGGTTLRGLGDGGVTASAGWDFVRLSANGDVLANRSDQTIYVVGASDACGVVVHLGESVTGGRLEWWSKDDLSTTSSRDLASLVPPGSGASDSGVGNLAMTADCRVIVPIARDFRHYVGGYVVSRDGSPAVTLAGYPVASTWEPIPLLDGGIVALERDAAAITVWDADGTVRWRRTYFPTSASPRWGNAGVLMPHGALYTQAATDNGTHFIAIAIGAMAAPMRPDFSASNWARTNAPAP